jgi:hypothetical protein
MSIATYLIEQGFIQGYMQGFIEGFMQTSQRGFQDGSLQGYREAHPSEYADERWQQRFLEEQRAILLLLLTARFAALAELEIRRVREAHLPEHERWAERLSSAVFSGEDVDEEGSREEKNSCRVAAHALLMRILEEGEKELEKRPRGATRRRAARHLLKQLTVRFGPLPEDAVQRVQTAGSADLDRWIERVLTAPTLAQVLGKR